MLEVHVTVELGHVRTESKSFDIFFDTSATCVGIKDRRVDDLAFAVTGLSTCTLNWLVFVSFLLVAQ